LIELLAYDDNEEIQCHAISTLRNLAASSERNKRAIVEAGAVERIKTLINKVPASVQTEMTAAIAVLALSDDLKQRLLSMGILEVLVELTSSSNMEVEGNSAAAIGNLSSKGKFTMQFRWLLLILFNSQRLYSICQCLEYSIWWS
jgi:vacuolar protein 8